MKNYEWGNQNFLMHTLLYFGSLTCVIFCYLQIKKKMMMVAIFSTQCPHCAKHITFIISGISLSGSHFDSYFSNKQ